MIELPAEARNHLVPPRSLARVVTRIAWIASTALGSLALAGWLLGVPTLYSGWPSALHMTVNGALMFVLLGLALRFTMNGSHAHESVKLTYRLGQLLAFLVAVASALILIEYLLKRNFGIDERIIKDSSAAAYKGIPGRPSFAAALNGILLGLGTVLMDIRFRRIWLAQGLILMSVLITVQALIGYVCDVSELYGQLHTNEGNGMTVHDSFGFVLLGVGLLCARPDRGLLAIVSSDTPGGMLARWLLLTPVIGLLLSGTLYVVLERAIQADSTFRIWALGLSNLVFLTVPIWVAAHLLHQVGLERDQAHHALEDRVQQRTAELTRANAALAAEVAERREAEQALREARDRLECQAAELERRVAERTAKLQETVGDLESFSYSVAHDMRAPLRGMQGFARLLLEGHASQLSAEAHGYLERIASSACRMDMLIRDVLNYTRVLQTRTSLVPVDLNQLVNHLIATYPDWQPPSVEIRIQGPLPAVLAHEGFLTQCVSNLVGNAVKFVTPGTLPRIRIWAEVANPEVMIWFEDNGIGIAPKDRDRIFRMFERLNPSDEYEGTGIGLTIVRKAVERMGGRVGFDSEPGKGSKFWLELKQAS